MVCKLQCSCNFKFYFQQPKLCSSLVLIWICEYFEDNILGTVTVASFILSERLNSCVVLHSCKINQFEKYISPADTHVISLKGVGVSF